MNFLRVFLLLAATTYTGRPVLGAAPPPPPPSSGYTEPFKLIKVSSLESGILAELLVRQGDVIKQGQVVAKLDTRLVESDRSIATEELARLTLRHDKLAALAKTRDAAVEEVERSASDLTIQKLRMERINTLLENYTVRSPLDGVVLEIKVEVGEGIAAVSSHLFTLVQVGKLVVNLRLPLAQARTFKVGDKAPLYFFDSQREVTGEVDFVSPLADPATGTLPVKFVIENSAGELQGGLRCGIKPTEKGGAKP